MNKTKYPRVLIVSHNALSNKTNMGKTIANFFSQWDKENLAQIFLLNETPDYNICKKYFQIEELSLLKSLVTNYKVGEELIKSPKTITNEKDRHRNSFIRKVLYQTNLKYKPMFYTLRNLLWKTNKWQTDCLLDWVDKYDPEVLFYAAGDFSFSMDIALYICKCKNIPLIVYFGDEYYQYKVHKYSPFAIFNRKIYHSNFKKLFSYLSVYLSASDSMNQLYSKLFNKKGYTILGSTEIQSAENKSDQQTIIYAGGLSLGRWRSLIDISQVLKSIGLKLDIYSSEKNRDILSKLEKEDGIRLHEFVNPEELQEIIHSSLLIVHVEDQSEKNKQRTMHSMSTKIPEMLGSGVCILAYGPEEVASMKYLATHDVACVVSEHKNLKTSIEKIINDSDMRQKYIRNARELAVERHDFDKNREKFLKIVKDVTIENSNY